MQAGIGAAPQTAREIAWKAQMRLCGRFRTLTRKGGGDPSEARAAASTLLMATAIAGVGQGRMSVETG